MYRRAKALFKVSRNSLASHQFSKQLRKEGFAIDRYPTQALMRKMNLEVHH